MRTEPPSQACDFLDMDFHVFTNEPSEALNECLTVSFQSRIATLLKPVLRENLVFDRRQFEAFRWRRAVHLLDLEHIPPEQISAEDFKVQPPLIASEVAVWIEPRRGLVVIDAFAIDLIHLTRDDERTTVNHVGLVSAQLTNGRQFDLEIT